MIVDIQTQDTTVTVPQQQEPLLIVQDLDLLHVGGGAGGTCHF